MRLRGLLVAISIVLSCNPARAADGWIATALHRIPADTEVWGKLRRFEIVDVEALKAVAGVGPGVRFSDFLEQRLSADDQRAVAAFLWRLSSTVGFYKFLGREPYGWSEYLGTDFLQIDWFSEIGVPPDRVLLLGGDALPSGEALAVLAKAGLAPIQRGGRTIWARVDDRASEEAVLPGFPFWGWLGQPVKIFRSSEALVGAQSWASFDLMMAMEDGGIESLADLPRYRLAVEAATMADCSSGPLLQMAFVDVGVVVIDDDRTTEQMPSYDLLALASREDSASQQVLTILTYGDDVQTAEFVAERLAGVLAVPDERGKKLTDYFPSSQAESFVVTTEDGTAAVLCMTAPHEPLKLSGGVVWNPQPLYLHLLRQMRP